MKARSRNVALLLVGGVVLAMAGVVALAQQPPPPPEAPEPPEPPEAMEWVMLGGPTWLGVTLSDINTDKARELKLPGEYGALIENVAEESPAAKAGLQKDDVIVGFGGERVRSVTQLTRLVRETPAGRKISVEIVRGGQTRTVEVTPETRRARWATPDIHISPMPEMAPHAMPNFNIEVMPRRGPRLGVTADEIEGQLAEYFGVKQGKGVLVKEVSEGSGAAKAGIKAGDVIIRINNEAVMDVEDLRRALSQAEKEATVTFVRDHREQSVKVELEQPATRRGPRRSAGVIEIDTDAWQRYAEEIARQMELRAADIEAQVRQQVEAKVQSKEFKQQMKELKEKMKDLETRLKTI